MQVRKRKEESQEEKGALPEVMVVVHKGRAASSQGLQRPFDDRPAAGRDDVSRPLHHHPSDERYPFSLPDKPQP